VPGRIIGPLTAQQVAEFWEFTRAYMAPPQRYQASFRTVDFAECLTEDLADPAPGAMVFEKDVQ
jgi:hypothetical protein